MNDNHGTYLASIIAASHNSGVMFGIAPNVKILPIKFLRGSQGEIKDAIKAIEYAYSLGVRIINCSWDTVTFYKDLLAVMEKYNDILFLCSAGKKGANLLETPVYPACFKLPNVVSVAALDNRGELYVFSGFGKEAEVGAPGVNIFSAMPDNDYTYSSGTSAATAYVTGIASLVKSYRPELTAIQIKKILLNGTHKLNNLKDKLLSEGIIDAYKCLQDADKFISK